MSFYYRNVNQHMLCNTTTATVSQCAVLLEAVIILVSFCPADKGDSRVELQRHFSTRCQVGLLSLHT